MSLIDSSTELEMPDQKGHGHDPPADRETAGCADAIAVAPPGYLVTIYYRTWKCQTRVTGHCPVVGNRSQVTAPVVYLWPRAQAACSLSPGFLAAWESSCELVLH